MTDFRERYGSRALVAGSSEGLGAAWASALATRGMDLILVARRKERLEELAASLGKEHRISVQIICCDLASPDAASVILASTGERPVDFLVYNAASSYIGPFLETPLRKHEEVESVNVSTMLRLVYHFGASMIERRRGGIVLMSSLAGFQGAGFLATYAASKAFTRILAESLWYEWKNKGVDMIACCAGATATPNYIATAPEKIGFPAPKPQTPENVVEETLHKLGKTPFFVSGNANKLAAFFMQRLFPRRLAIRIMGDTARKMYRIKY